MNPLTENRRVGGCSFDFTSPSYFPLQVRWAWVPLLNSAPTPSPQLEFERERAAFEHQLPELKQTHGGQYVAVHRGMVVAAGSTEAEVTQRFFTKFGDTHVYIGYVGDQEPPTFQVSPITSAD